MAICYKYIMDVLLLDFKLCLLLVIANGTPIIIARLLGDFISHPIDGNIHFYDNRPIFGTSKTWRGIVSAIVITPIAAKFMQLPLEFGVLFAVFAMLGDLSSSFIKRRAGITPSGMALGLDQIPESLFPLLLSAVYFEIGLMHVIMLVFIFTIMELLLSRLLYKLHIRKQPY